MDVCAGRRNKKTSRSTVCRAVEALEGLACSRVGVVDVESANFALGSGPRQAAECALKAWACLYDNICNATLLVVAPPGPGATGIAPAPGLAGMGGQGPGRTDRAPPICRQMRRRCTERDRFHGPA